MAVKITIPVDFQDSAQSYKKIIASLQSELKKVKPGTTIYENISSQLKKANSLILKLEGNIGQGMASHAEIERIIKDFSSLQTVVESVNDAYATMSIKNLNINSENFGDLAKDLVDAASQLTKAKKALSDAEGLNIGELFQGDANIGKFTAKQLTSKGKSFYDSLAAQIERLGIKSNEAEQEVKTLEQSLIDLQQQANNLKSDSLAESITEIVGTAGSKTSKKGQFVSLADAQTNLLNITQNKFFTKKGLLKAGVSQDQVKDWLKAFGISDESIAKILETSKDRIERLRQAINAEFTNTRKNELVTKYRDAAAESIQRQAVEKQIAEVNANLKTARSTANDYSGELKGIQEQFNLLKDKLIKRGVLGATEGEAGDLQKQIDAIEQQMASLQSAIVAQGPKAANNLPDTPSREATDQAFDAERDAQQFKDNLKQAIAHWLSAQQVITMVKEGIRQAWTDIQGLDKAMTNIAVVTDMSVSDLWGKINDYMAIAQEYGVTTQGVYEVSQLYYQQGLSTNEVMEATTETLKMARIAGMDYAEAADAMTVAIRAFKMEMSDAQTITDVYSKVAAVTASDSEELAIAMSKTASSAESVGSSFENTTAMLAVMIETTRESAQNLGSALKSIISRYGEMKVGLTVDSEGEEIDYNKVDTALQSVGISIKDAQGQFRDFDEVIFELSKKWGSLDKNTQRYIATIMAGNRQQSRFIALVDNWERLEEVSAAAYDSQDAGLLQYAKTLDSLETKLNALSTSFQQFYMSIINGDTFKGIIDMVTNFINGLNQLGSWPAILNVGLLLKSLKTIATTFVNSFSNPLSGIVNQYKSTFSQITSLAFSEGVKAGQNHAKGVEVGISGSSVQSGVTGTTKRRIQGIKTGTDRKFIRKKGFELRQQQQQNDPFSLTNKQAKFAKGTSIVGPLLTMLGTSVANKHAGWGATISGFGNVASGIAAGSGFGAAGMAIGGIIAGIASLPAIVEGFSPDKILAQKIQSAEEVLNEAEITRATKKEEARNLQSTIENLRKLQKARYSSEEAEKAFIEASNAAFEQFPQLTATFDETGNAIIDVISETSNAEQLLIEARKAAADAAEEAAAAELKLNAEKQKQAQNEYDKYYKNNTKVDTFARNLGQQYGYLNFNGDSYRGKNVLEIADGYFAAIDSYLKDYEIELRDFWGYSEEQIVNEIARERELLEGSFFTQLSGSGIGITLDQEDLTLRGLKTSAGQAQQKLNSTTGVTNASREASINRTIDNLLLDIDPNQTGEWLEIEGTTNTFYERVKNVIGDPESAFDPVTKELLPNVKDTIYEVLETYTNAWNEISSYLTTSYQKEDFNELLNAGKNGSITFSEFQEQYQKMFEGASLSENAQTELNEASKEIEDNNRKAIGQLALTLSDDHGFKWDKHGVLLEKLKNIPQQYFANLYDFAETIDAQLEEGLINESQAKDLTSRYLQMWEGLSTAGLDSEALGQARNALASADLFSIGGVDALTSTLKDLGVETENLPGLKDFPVYAVNFTTEYATLIEKMNKGMESLRELLSNLADGLETEDAEKLAKKMGTTLSDSSAFEFIDGKWYVKNVETAIAAIEKTYNGLQAQLKATLDDSVGKLSGTVSASDEEIKQLVSINEESAKKWAAEQAAKGVTNLPSFDADGGRSLVAAYLKAEYEGITKAYETEKAWLIAEAERSIKISQHARRLAGGEDKKREQEALGIIKNNGLTGYTAEDVATITTDTILGEGAFKRKADGSFDLKESIISTLPQYIQDAIYQQMDEEAESAIDAIKSLGEIVASKKSNGAYAKVFKRKTEELGYKEADTYMQSLIERAMGGDNDALNELWAEVAYEIPGNQLNIDDSRVKEAIDGMFDSIKDNTAENALKFIELSTKAIENTLTNAEQTELDNLKIDSQWAKDLTATLAQEDLSIVQKNAAIITATLNAAKEKGIGWDQIEDTIQQGYTDLLKAYQAEAQGFAITDVNSLGITESIVDEAGFYSSDSLTEFFVQAQKEGYTMDSSNFKKVFKWDEVTNSWVKIAGSKLSNLFGQEVPSWMEEAFRKSENQKVVSEAIRIDDASKTVTETVGELYSNAATASLDDLISLYETIHGEGSFTESGLLDDYQHAVTEAKKGNIKILQSFLENLVKEAKGINIDTTALQNTIQDAALALMGTIASTVESGISGTMTNTDYTQLLKDIGVNQFEPDDSISQDWERWQNMVYSTNEGLKFTKQGLLDIYGVVASRNAMASQGILEMIAEDYREYDNLSSTLAHIKELRDLKDKADPTKRKQYEQELAVAEKIARIRSQDPESFNFMNRAIPDEIQSPLNVWQNAADAASALQDAKTNGYMGAEDFYRIVTTASEYMTAAGQEFSVAGMTYEDLISKATSSLATANGNLVVDFSKFGVDFAGGIDDMAGGLEDGLKELARQQIEMLDGMIAMLETMKTIQDIGKDIDKDADGLFDFRELFDFNEITGVVDLKETTIKWWNEFQSVFGIMTFDGLHLDDAWKQGKITATEITNFMNDAQSIIDNATSDINGMIAQLVGAAQAAFGTDVAIELGLNLEKQFEFKDDGTVVYNGTPYPNEAEALAAWKKEVAKTTDGFTDQIDPVVTADGTVITYKRDIETDIIYEVHTNKDGVSTFVINNIPCKSEEELNKKLQELAPEAKTIEGETAENQFLAGGTYSGVEYKVGNQVKVSDQDGNNSVILGEGKSLATWVKETFESITEEDANNSGEERWFDGGSYPGIKYQFGTAVQVNGQPYASISEFITGALGAAIQSQSEYATVNMNLTATADTDEAKTNLDEVIKKLGTIEETKNKEITITASTSRAYNQLNSILNLINSIKSKTVTIHTEYTSSGTPPSGEGTGGGGEQKPGVENLSTNAKGNVALAKGTLMGELGPELYVQNGSYHVAGSNGPEFVDLADDAIVFNHLQTKRILNTGHSFGRGTPVTNERRAVAWATGNVTGPARAGGIDSAIEQLKTAREFWKGLLNQLSLSELMAGSGGHKGGGSGNSIKAVTEELQEWYNLSRQIADIEQDINNLLAERENIEWSNGEEYLKSLREQQKLLNKQISTQKALLDYQELQLQRQADQINQNSIWSQFLTVGEDGLLQYIKGNETNGGKGALEVLQELNQMSGEEQTAFLKRIGYSYTDNDGNKLEGSDLVEQFFQELQDQIDQYDSLYDTVNETHQKLEELETTISEINDEIKENQMDLEEAIYDIIVEAWEAEIEQMQEQADLIKEANDAYINGLNEAISAERELYDQNQSIADREQLQRQLSLLRRSGGSASEIADLESQLNDMLKDEYFDNQERMIESIQEANDRQVEQLDEQIRLQEEALEYQKENGVIWTKVYEVMSQSKDAILEFMQGNSTEFFSQSLLQQEQMLTDWAHKIGIYTENRKYENYANFAKENIWDTNAAWSLGDLGDYKSTYEAMSDDDKNTIRELFSSTYANARLDGKDNATASQEAADAVYQALKRKQDSLDAENNKPPTTNPNPQGGNDDDDDDGSSGGGSSGGGSSGSTYSTITLTCTAGNTGGSPKLSTYSAKPKQTVTVSPNANSGYAFDYLTYNGNQKTGTTITPTGQVKSIAVVVYYKKTSASSSSSGNGSYAAGDDVDAISGAAPSTTGWHYWLNDGNGNTVYKDPKGYNDRGSAQSAAQAMLASKKYPKARKYSTKWYMKGGLVDYTGLAMVHGSETKPESFLNAEQTAQIREGLEITSGKSSTLEGIRDSLLKLNTSIQSLTNINNTTESNTYTIAPGAVVIRVEQLNDAYDVDTLSADVMNRIYAIGNKATNRGVSRR